MAEQFTNLFEELRKERNSFMEMGIDFEEKAFYDILKAIAEKYKFWYKKSQRRKNGLEERVTSIRKERT